MSATIVSHSPAGANRDPLERGRFSDGRRTFTVLASSAEAPDSFQVYANGNPQDIVLIVSGLTSGNLHATWGQHWRTVSQSWREWFEDSAFQAFYNGSRTSQPATRRPSPGGERFCDG